MERQGDLKQSKPQRLMQIFVANLFLQGQAFLKAKDPAFDEPAVGSSTIATAPSPLICPEDTLGKDSMAGVLFPRSINWSLGQES